MDKIQDESSADDYRGQARKIQKRLASVSPSFCLAKWLQVSLQLTTGRTQSCYHPAPHVIPKELLADNPGVLHNTPYKKIQRAKMLAGKRPAECQYCWDVEDLGADYLSDRHFRSSESWAVDRFEEVQKLPWDADIVPSYIEVNFNQTCQLKCSYCAPHVSSAWMSEVKQHGPYPTRFGHNRLDWFEERGMIPIPDGQPNPYIEAFWKWWPQVVSKIRVFRMTGGEPLLDPNTYKIFEYLLEKPNPELTLSITSNFSAKPPLMEKFLKYAKRMHEEKAIKDFQLFLSLDSTGDRAEYIRHGLDFDYFMGNVQTFLEEIPSANISFILTACNLAASSLKDTLAQFRELRLKYNTEWQRIHFDTPMLKAPEFLSLQILSKDFLRPVRDALEFARGHAMGFDHDFSGFSGAEIAKLERLLAWMEQDLPPDQLKGWRADFFFFVREHDRRRGTNFLNTFPEMKDFLSLCEEAARDEKPYIHP